MHSIRRKIIVLMLLCIFVSASLIGSISILNINHEEEYASIQIINATCQALAAKMNAEIDTVMQSVNSAAKIAEDMPHPDWYSFLDTMQTVLEDIAEETENSVSVYLSLDPEITGSEMGIMMNRTSEGFLPVETQNLPRIEEPVWTEPYDSAISGMHVISYMVPIHDGGEIIGLMGMDVHFDTFTIPAKETVVYESGYAYLMDDDGKVYYHPVLVEGTIPSETESTLPSVLYRFTEEDNGDELITYYSYAGIERKTAFVKLHNGMDVVISADSNAIYVRRDDLLRKTILIMLIVAVVAVVMTVWMTRRITEPLVQLTAVAEEMTQGHLDVALPDETNDEVGTLTRAFRVMMQYLKRYISDINALAYRDPLTNVKNKHAYHQMMDALGDQMKGTPRAFALVVLDANGLKQINDRMGHAQGDLYLQNTCHLICSIFKRSPVYRIGGDEFVILLEGEDYAQRMELLQALDAAMALAQKNADPVHQISLAAGMSEAQPSDTSPQTVFERADAAMYQKKHEMKSMGRV